tara:strand:+ start:195 stop:1154 length:960 start_codon:yes stop_codon:yes gene_type:complete
MKRKTIRKILKQNIGPWLESIKDDEVRRLAKRDTIVTGGCITSMLLHEKINDFDIYFKTRETTLAVAKYYLDEFLARNPATNDKVELTVDDSKPDRIAIHAKSVGIVSEDQSVENYQYFESRPDEEGGHYVTQAAGTLNSPGSIQDAYEELEEQSAEVTSTDPADAYRPVFMSSNAITLSDRIQIIIRFYGEPEEIHGNYDFVHCTNYWTASDDNLVLRPKALEAILARELVYVGSKYPVCSVIRLRKFIRRGWQINAGQILKMVMQINDLDLNNIEVLQDQLTGVDSAYFHQVIGRLKEKDSTRVDSAYLVEIIDRIF